MIIIRHKFCACKEDVSFMHSFFFFLTLYTARPSFKYYRQVYFVHSGLQDESLQVTQNMLLQKVTIIDHEYILFSESTVSQIDFELVSISKNQSLNLQEFTACEKYQKSD